MFVCTAYMFEALVLGVLHLDNRLSSFDFCTNTFVVTRLTREPPEAEHRFFNENYLGYCTRPRMIFGHFKSGKKVF